MRRSVVAALLSAALMGAGFEVHYARESFSQVEQAVYLHNSNLTESLVAADRLLDGRGLTMFDDVRPYGIGQVSTYRMPGYPLVVAFSAWMGRAQGLVRIAKATVILQGVVTALTIGVFVAAASRLWPERVVILQMAAVLSFPVSVDMTQADSLILACGLLITAALIRWLENRERYWAVHGAFALYFLMRSDVLVGWLVVSLWMHRKQWRRLAIPLFMLLLIGSAWGGYKWAHGGDFVMTTSNVGHVAFVGLWQVPSRFTWQPKDESYDAWISAHGYHYTEPRANAFALGEVMRFWLAYPGFIAGNVAAKLRLYFTQNVWVGTLQTVPSVIVGRILRNGGSILLMMAILASLLAGYERERLWILGWPLFCNLPLFCLLQESSGRFVPYVSVTLAILGISVLGSREFYRRLSWPIVATCVIVIIAVGAASPWLLSDPVRYWNPLRIETMLDDR